MTGYQKLKVENSILWIQFELALEAIYSEYENQDELVNKVLDDVKWKIKRAQHEEKD